MTWRRRPIPKRLCPWLAAAEGPSLRYELVCDGAVRKYPDGREVCEDSLAGRREYLRRLGAMLTRQGNRCCLCCHRIYALYDATFEHQRRRGMGSAWRDDRIVDAEGQWINGRRTGPATKKGDECEKSPSKSARLCTACSRSSPKASGYLPTPVQGIVETLIDHAQQGVYRPGAWERQWLEHVFPEGWQEHLEPGDPSGGPNGEMFQRPKRARSVLKEIVPGGGEFFTPIN